MMDMLGMPHLVAAPVLVPLAAAGLMLAVVTPRRTIAR